MRPLLLAVASVACLASGCGTLANLTAPPPTGISDDVLTCCHPFGGVARSAEESCFLLALVLQDGWPLEQVPEVLLCTGVGAAGLIDLPLSLAGDIVTLPIACARERHAPWALRWGRKSQPITAERPNQTDAPGRSDASPDSTYQAATSGPELEEVDSAEGRH